MTVTGTGRSRETFPPDELEAGWKDIDSVAQQVRDLGCGALPLVVDVTRGDQVSVRGGSNPGRVWPYRLSGKQRQRSPAGSLGAD